MEGGPPVPAPGGNGRAGLRPGRDLRARAPRGGPTLPRAAGPDRDGAGADGGGSGDAAGRAARTRAAAARSQGGGGTSGAAAASRGRPPGTRLVPVPGGRGADDGGGDRGPGRRPRRI